VAREVAALTGKPCKFPDPLKALEKVWGPASVEDGFSVENREPELCLRYSGMVIEDVQPGPSPKWLADRLTAIGLRPINNIVDITNFVLMEYGQPLHAFDRDLLEGSSIVVRRADTGESFTSLDGTDLNLGAEALVIADAVKPVALAGIMGAANSQVTESTRHLVLESACFDPVVVRKGSKKYGLRTDSSMRFERGVDIEAVISAQARAALLITELAGGKIRKGRIDVYPSPSPKRSVTLRVSRVNQVLGCSLSAEQIGDYLSRLGMNVSGPDAGETFRVEIPTFRPVLAREIDLIEEVARLNGFDKIEVTSPVARINPVRFSPRQSATRQVREILSHLGYSETITYSFIDPESAAQFQSAFASGSEMETIPLSNPISSEMGTMRPSLVPGLIQLAVRNLSNGRKQVKVFELGHVFLRDKKGQRTEKVAFSGLAAGIYENNVWKATGKNYDYYDLKGILDSVAAQFKLKLTERPASGRPYMLSGKTVELLAGDRVCGYLGELSPGTIRQYELPKHSVVFELDFYELVDALPGPVRFASLPKYPETYRDISILIDKAVSSGEVSDRIYQVGAPLLRQVELYDHFAGKKIEAGKKSLTYALTFQSADKTLTDAEVNPVFEKIVKTLSSQWGATLRE
ncbi:MAG: phenylalanine--tRNA ligase subunit beta, partial [Nitrospinae bacterium]|nr:phenylalanine--tRNA ligase subunit beta [Nitrospinota bacterium]